jgi:hypothetical protein
MSSLADGVSQYAGVAVFVDDPRLGRRGKTATLVAALSEHLIQSGDTRVIT